MARTKKNMKYLYKKILIMIISVYIVMKGLQYFLDANRKISLHCYIRNISIVFAIYYLLTYPWSWYIFFLPFLVELIIEILNSTCRWPLDPDENKTINCYNWFEKASRADPGLDYYTEGYYPDKKNTDISMEEAQFNKFKWMCDAGKIKEGTRVLDIGSGRCDFLNYAKQKREALVTGCTISPDQIDICKKRNIDVFITDITNDPIPEKYKGKFDVIVLNGSAEHFRQRCNKGAGSVNLFWKDFFKKLELLFDPSSKNKRIVITMIHQRREFDFIEKVHYWFLDKGFGGTYLFGKYGLVDNAENYNVEFMKDATEDYYLYSEKWGAIARKNMPAITYNHLKNIIPQLVNNPYYIHTFYAVSVSWIRQFMPTEKKSPPMLQQWIILKSKYS